MDWKPGRHFNVASLSGGLPLSAATPFYFDITGSARVFGGIQPVSRVKLFPEAGTAWLMLIGMVLAAAGVRLPHRRRVK